MVQERQRAEYDGQESCIVMAGNVLRQASCIFVKRHG